MKDRIHQPKQNLEAKNKKRRKKPRKQIKEGCNSPTKQLKLENNTVGIQILDMFGLCWLTKGWFANGLVLEWDLKVDFFVWVLNVTVCTVPNHWQSLLWNVLVLNVSGFQIPTIRVFSTKSKGINYNFWSSHPGHYFHYIRNTLLINTIFLITCIKVMLE